MAVEHDWIYKIVYELCKAISEVSAAFAGSAWELWYMICLYWKNGDNMMKQLNVRMQKVTH